MSGHHSPVMLDESMAALSIKPDGIYVDGTYGRGGHSRALLGRLGAGGQLLAFDKDPDACAAAWQELGREPRFHLERGSFSGLEKVAVEAGYVGKVDGILLDLGVSSPQLDNAERGFSFKNDGPLDMRMDTQSGVSAAEWLADADREEISRVLKLYGEERFHWRVAGAIVNARDELPIETTHQLADIIRDVVPVSHKQRIDPATRSFQGIRIFINHELDDLELVLEQSLRVLAPGGRLVVISFHSLEDRIVKRFMRSQAQPEQSPVPMAPLIEPLLKLCGKAVRANDAEIECNPRSRSAVLRVAERTAAGVQV